MFPHSLIQNVTAYPIPLPSTLLGKGPDYKVRFEKREEKMRKLMKVYENYLVPELDV